MLDGVLHGLGPVGEGRRRVHARHVLGHARAGINPEDFLDEFVLPQVDVGDRNRRQERFEHRTGTRMVAGQKCLGALAQIRAHVIWIRVTDTPSRLYE